MCRLNKVEDNTEPSGTSSVKRRVVENLSLYIICLVGQRDDCQVICYVIMNVRVEYLVNELLCGHRVEGLAKVYCCKNCYTIPPYVNALTIKSPTYLDTFTIILPPYHDTLTIKPPLYLDT